MTEELRETNLGLRLLQSSTVRRVRKVLRALERAFLAVFDAGDWVIDWLDHQSTAIILGLGMLLGVGATLIVAAIFASLR